LKGHSAHINREVEVHYRWHALYGRKVRQLYAERRSRRKVVVVEAAPGVAIVLAAWMLDPAICATMSLGTPTVDVVGLADLDRLLKALGLRRTCSDEPPSAGELHRKRWSVALLAGLGRISGGFGGAHSQGRS
jgi:hypothetical protein